MTKKSKKKKDKKSFPEKVYTGILSMAKSGTGFVDVESLEKGIIIRDGKLGTAVNGDEVKVRLTRKDKENRRKVGEIVEIVKRKTTTFVGSVELSKGFGFLVTADDSLPDIYIDKKYLKNAKSGDKAVVEILDWGNKKNNPSGRIVTLLSKEDANDTAMKSILIETGFSLSFPKAVLKEADTLKERIDEKELAKRRDMRDVFTLTIDPADSKDFDDALSIKKLGNDLFEVGVHIADLSHYVRPGSELDKEAYERGTSVYLADRVSPMLPEQLSNKLCSLRPHEEKLTFSAIFQISSTGKIKKTWIGKTVCRSDLRLDYKETQKIIDGKKAEHDREILWLHQIASSLREARMKSGAINFSSEEIRFILDEKARPVGIEKVVSTEANFLIEEFMLLANKAVATFMDGIQSKNKNIPFPYRVHDTPDGDKLKIFVGYAEKRGYRFNMSSPQTVAASFNRMLAQAKGKPEQAALEQLGIRTMAKAVYTTDNIGHYGLSFANYCHFTAPIRRYPDIMAHRILYKCLNKQPVQIKKKDLEKKCIHCSEQERNAMEAERAAEKYKQVEYMQQFLGEEFDAVISGVAGFGFWAETVDTKCEGMVSIMDLEEHEGDEFRYIDTEYALKATHSNKMFQMGDLIKIKVVAANLEKRQLDYMLV